MTTTDRFAEVPVDTKAQSYILTALHEKHARILRMLDKIAGEAATATERNYFDTPFLLNPCAGLAAEVAEHQTLKDAARWAGCTPEQVASVCIKGHVIVEVRS